MTVEKANAMVDEIFSVVQNIAEAGLGLTAIGICYGINELFYYWPLMQHRLA